MVGVMFSKISTLLVSWKFRNCKIELCSFSRLDIKGTSFIECYIKETDFVDANLTNVNFMSSDLLSSRFQNSNLTKANFKLATNYYINPTQNIIKKASFSQPEVLSLLAGFDIEIS
jgi:uncharacterized protein YjbI with pentapeptide repeats